MIWPVDVVALDAVFDRALPRLAFGGGGTQAVDQLTGLPVWDVWVLVFDGRRRVPVRVQVPASVCPSGPEFAPVQFSGLVVSDWSSNGRSGVSVKASGVVVDSPARKAG